MHVIMKHVFGTLILGIAVLGTPACSQDNTTKPKPIDEASICPDGQAALQDEDGARAITALQDCLTEREYEWTVEADLRMRLAAAYLAEEEPQEALIAYNQIMALMGDNGADPDNPFILRNRAIAYLELERWDDALEDLDIAKRVEPQNAFTHLLIGSTYMESDRHEEAVAAFDQAVRLEPDNINHLAGRSGAFVELEMYEAGIDDGREAVSIDPENATALNALCWAMVEAGRASEALDICEQAVEADPESGSIIHSRAAALEQVGRMDEARELYAQAYEKNPDSDRIEEDYQRSRDF